MLWRQKSVFGLQSIYKKVYINRDFFIKEKHIYYPKAPNDWDYSEDNWMETDDAQFANVGDLDNLESDDSFYSIKENTSR